MSTPYFFPLHPFASVEQFFLSLEVDNVFIEQASDSIRELASMTTSLNGRVPSTHRLYSSEDSKFSFKNLAKYILDLFKKMITFFSNFFFKKDIKKEVEETDNEIKKTDEEIKNSENYFEQKLSTVAEKKRPPFSPTPEVLRIIFGSLSKQEIKKCLSDPKAFASKIDGFIDRFKKLTVLHEAVYRLSTTVERLLTLFNRNDMVITEDNVERISERFIADINDCYVQFKKSIEQAGFGYVEDELELSYRFPSFNEIYKYEFTNKPVDNLYYWEFELIKVKDEEFDFNIDEELSSFYEKAVKENPVVFESTYKKLKELQKENHKFLKVSDNVQKQINELLNKATKISDVISDQNYEITLDVAFIRESLKNLDFIEVKDGVSGYKFITMSKLFILASKVVQSHSSFVATLRTDADTAMKVHRQLLRLFALK